MFMAGDAGFRRSNLFRDVIHTRVNWDHAAWWSVAVPRMLSTIDDQPDCVFGHEPETYGDYPSVPVVGETEFGP